MYLKCFCSFYVISSQIILSAEENLLKQGPTDLLTQKYTNYLLSDLSLFISCGLSKGSK